MREPLLPVQDPAEFVGQTNLVRRIFSRVGADRPQSVAVIGGIRSGKTSLLDHLGHPAVASRWLEHPGDYLFLRGPQGPGEDETPESFLTAMAEGLPPGPQPGPNAYEDIRLRIEARHAAGQRMVVLLDDFHTVTSNDRFSLEFFSFLRSMANNYNLAYVTTSFLELQKLCVAKEIQESPFFNIFTNMHLGMLSREDACDLLGRHSGAGAAVVGRVVDWLGTAPWPLKIAAGWLAEAGPTPGEKEFLKDLYPLVEPHFRDLVGTLSPEAQRPLQALGREKMPLPSDLHHLGPLVKEGYLLEDSQGRLSGAPALTHFLRHGLDSRLFRGSC